MRCAGAAEIVIHVGAHKTATTHLQQFLEGERQELSQHGVAYFGPERIRPFFARWRRGWLRRFSSSCDYVDGLAALVQPAVIAGDRVVISEENLLGYCRHIIERGVLYGEARRQAEDIARVFSGRQVVIHFAMRDYADFYPSAFAENLRDLGRSFVRFDEVRGTLLENPRGWGDVVDDFCAVFGAERIRLWRVEDYRGRHSTVARALTGVELEGRRGGARIVRQGMSHAAVMKIEELARTTPQTELNRLIPEIDAMFPKGEYPPYDPLSPVEKGELTARYARDVERLRARLPEAWILEPDGR